MVGATRRGLLLVAISVACACCALAPAAQASPSVPFTTITGSSSGGTSVPTAIANFKAAVGGGSRQLTWDGIAVDGTAPGSTVIAPGHVVAVARSAGQPWGLELGANVAVANDGFASVNSHAGFAPFSSPNEWAPYNTNTAELQIVTPTAATGSPQQAVTRGLGVVFLNVKTAGTTIQYYSGNALLSQASAPLGATSFVGVAFRDPVVTRVVVTMGTATLFNFDGTPGGQDPNTLVTADDVVQAEPGAGESSTTATAGVAASLVFGSFTDSGATPRDLTAAIDWGDGNRTSGTIAPVAGGGFVITGSHAYTLPGSYTATATVEDLNGGELTTQASIQVSPRATTTSLSCSPSPVAVTASTMCTAMVADIGPGNAITPTGTVAFSSPTAGASFASDSGCVLGATEAPGVAICEVQFTPTQLPPPQAKIIAAYGGDVAHGGSSDTAVVGVRAQRCTLKALPARLKAHPAVLGMIVTCDARANVTIGVKATGARKGRVRAFAIEFGSLRTTVTGGRPTVLVIKPSQTVLGVLRQAGRRHQRVSLRLTLTATSHATRATTTRAAAVRIR